MINPTIKQRNVSPSKGRRKARKFATTPTREEIEKAVHEYLLKGGKITRVEPEWIEEGKAYIFI